MNDTMKLSRLKQKLPNYTLLFVVAGVFIVFSILLPATYPTQSNIMTFLRQGSIYGFVLLGVTFVLSVGEMDVSFPDVAAFSSVLTALLMGLGIPCDLAALISIGCGVLFGSLSGFLTTKFRLHSLIVTIAVSGIAKSLALLLGGGTTIPIQKPVGTFFYSVIWGTVGGEALAIPVVFLVMVGAVILLVIVQEKTKFGQYVYAIGDNREAAEVAGIKINPVIRKTMMLSSTFAAFGGVLLMLMVNSGQPTMGSTLFLESFTQLFLGALLFRLGKTNMLGTFVGAILISMLSNGLTQLGTPSYIAQIITGILLVIGVTISSLSQRKLQSSLRLEG